MNKIIIAHILVAFFLSGQVSTAQVSIDSVRDKMLARAAALDLKTKYIAPPGNALSHHTAGFLPG